MTKPVYFSLHIKKKANFVEVPGRRSSLCCIRALLHWEDAHHITTYIVQYGPPRSMRPMGLCKSMYRFHFGPLPSFGSPLFTATLASCILPLHVSYFRIRGAYIALQLLPGFEPLSSILHARMMNGIIEESYKPSSNLTLLSCSNSEITAATLLDEHLKANCFGLIGWKVFELSDHELWLSRQGNSWYCSLRVLLPLTEAYSDMLVKLLWREPNTAYREVPSGVRIKRDYDVINRNYYPITLWSNLLLLMALL